MRPCATPETSSPQDDFPGLDDALRRLGLLDASSRARWTPLTGGVSSDIWRADLPSVTLCVKRARAVLAVAAEWHAPVERSQSEVAWLEVAREIAPDAVPRVLGQLPDANLFVMEYLDPARFPVWKGELSVSRVDDDFAAQVGTVLGEIHAQTAGNEELAERFATDDLFHTLRIEPYLETTAAAHPDLVTSAARVAAAAKDGACNTVLVKPNQAGTLTEARDALSAARAADFGAVVSARSGENEDTTIMHLAVGWGATQLKVGSITRGERTAKWNEGLRIAEELGGGGPLPDPKTFPWGRSQ